MFSFLSEWVSIPVCSLTLSGCSPQKLGVWVRSFPQCSLHSWSHLLPWFYLLFFHESYLWPSLDTGLSPHRNVWQTPTLNNPSSVHDLCFVLSLPFSPPSPWTGFRDGVITPYLPDIVPGTSFCIPCLEALDSGLPFLFSWGCLSSGLHNFLCGPLSLFLNWSSLFRPQCMWSKWILFYPSLRQLVFLKCILLLFPSLILNWPVAFTGFQNPSSLVEALPVPRALRGFEEHLAVTVPQTAYGTMQCLPKLDFCLSVCLWSSLAFSHSCML